MIVRMWEVVAHPEAHQDLLGWVCDAALPRVEHSYAYVSGEVFTSTDGRIVVLTRWRGEPEELPEPPRHLVQRAPHSWDFSPVDR